MIDRLATSAGLRLLRHRFEPPTRHWRHRIWDGDRAEGHLLLGPAYQRERAAIVDLLNIALSGFPATTCSEAPTSMGEGSTVVVGIDVACGTGRYTRELLRAGASHVVCVDVSSASLTELLSRTDDPSQVSPIEGDLFDPSVQQGIEDAVAAAGGSAIGATAGRAHIHRIVVCCDAIHHLGNPADVLTTLQGLAGTNGVVVGDIWTLDRFHEFQRLRRGRIEAAAGAIRFAMAAVVNAVARRPLLHAARSLLLPASEVVTVVADVFGADQVETTVEAYWVRFLTRL